MNKGHQVDISFRCWESTSRTVRTYTFCNENIPGHNRMRWIWISQSGRVDVIFSVHMTGNCLLFANCGLFASKRSQHTHTRACPTTHEGILFSIFWSCGAHDEEDTHIYRDPLSDEIFFFLVLPCSFKEGTKNTCRTWTTWDVAHHSGPTFYVWYLH